MKWNPNSLTQNLNLNCCTLTPDSRMCWLYKLDYRMHQYKQLGIKQKQSRLWVEMCGYSEMIYADAHVRDDQSSVESSSWQIDNQGWRPWLSMSHWGREDVRPWRKHSMVWSKKEVMGQCGCLYLSPSICLSLLHSYSQLQPLSKELRHIFITKCCGFFLHHGYIIESPIQFSMMNAIILSMPHVNQYHEYHRRKWPRDF